MTDEKRCTSCGETKPLYKFPRDGSRKDGRHSWCTICKNRRAKERRQRNPERFRQAGRDYYHRTRPTRLRCRRKSLLKIQYGLAIEDYDQMLEEQGGVCAVCRQPCSTGRHLAVDHNHNTGHIRSLLCGNCNHVLGKVHEDPDLLRQLALYLEKHA